MEAVFTDAGQGRAPPPDLANHTALPECGNARASWRVSLVCIAILSALLWWLTWKIAVALLFP